MCNYIYRLLFSSIAILFIDKAFCECSGNDLRQTQMFLQDYLTCTAGSMDVCDNLDQALRSGAKSYAKASSAEMLRQYMSSKLYALATVTLGDPKKAAADGAYRKVQRELWGGKEVDRLLSKYDNNLERAISATKEDISKSRLLLNKTGSPANVNDLIELRNSQIQNLKHLEHRADAIRQNNKILQEAFDLMDRHNSKIAHQSLQITQQMSRLDVSSAEWKNLERKRAEIENKTLKLETNNSNIVKLQEAHIRRRLGSIENKIAETTATNEKALLQKEHEFLRKGKHIGATQPSSEMPRLIWEVHDGKIAAVDISQPQSELPKWAKAYRQSAVQEFPKVIKSVLDSHPQILDDLSSEEKIKQFKEELSAAEHERWRNWRRQRLVDSYQSLRKDDPEHYKDMKFPIDKEGKLSPKVALTDEQNKALNAIKPDWIRADTPWSHVEDIYKKKTRDQIGHDLARFPFWESNSKQLQVLKSFFVKNPELSKALSRTIKYGPGLAVDAALIWYDYYSLRELVLQVSMDASDTVADSIWSEIKPLCRMPRSSDVRAEVEPGKYSRWFCKCEETSKKISELDKSCFNPTQADDKEICRALRASGRNKDILLAKKYKELKVKDKEKAELIRASVGCDVMMNYQDDCRMTTDQITEQGLYFISLIANENLFDEVPAICPNVCEHWKSIAELKISEWENLRKKLNLPTHPKENLPPANCQKECGSDMCDHDGIPIGKAKNSFDARKNFEQCQPVFKCNANKPEVEVNLRGLGDSRAMERYVVSFNPNDKIVKSVGLITTFAEEVAPLSPFGLPFKKPNFKDYNGFYYMYDDAGGLDRIEIANDRGRSNEVKVISTKMLVSEYGDDAYNPNSNLIQQSELGRKLGLSIPKQTLSWEDQVVARRTEIAILANEAIKYCCENGNQCLSSTDSSDRSQKDHQSVK